MADPEAVAKVSHPIRPAGIRVGEVDEDLGDTPSTHTYGKPRRRKIQDSFAPMKVVIISHHPTIFVRAARAGGHTSASR